MAKAAKKGLGKGLGALLGGDLTEETKKEEPQEKIVVETKIVEVPKEVYLKISMIDLIKSSLEKSLTRNS